MNIDTTGGRTQLSNANECIKPQGVSMCLLSAQEGPVALKYPDESRVISSLTYHYSTGE